MEDHVELIYLLQNQEVISVEEVEEEEIEEEEEEEKIKEEVLKMKLMNGNQSPNLEDLLNSAKLPVLKMFSDSPFPLKNHKLLISSLKKNWKKKLCT